MNYKGILQEWTQKNKMSVPVYDCETNGKMFTGKVYVNDKLFIGEAKETKKDAEQYCAGVAIRFLKIQIPCVCLSGKTDIMYAFKEGYERLLRISDMRDCNKVRYYLTCAFLHPSYKEENLRNWLTLDHTTPLKVMDYTPLATLGDSIIKSQQTMFLINKSLKNNQIPKAGDLTQSRMLIESRAYMKKIVLQAGLHKYILYKVELDIEKTSIPAEVLEAFIGAVHILGGEEKVTFVMKQLGLFDPID